MALPESAEAAAPPRSGFLGLTPIGPEMQNRRPSFILQTSRRSLQRSAAGFIGLCGVYQVALGIYFIAFRPSFLPEDLRFFGATREILGAALPRLETWLHLVFTVPGGQMAAVGMLVIAAALRLGYRRAIGRGEFVLLAAAGALSVGLMTAVNFALESDFRWLLTVPVSLWALGLVLGARNLGAAGAPSVEDKHAG